MMKKYIISTLCLLAALAAHADGITADSITVYGNLVAMMKQEVRCYVKNKSDKSFEGRWYVLAKNLTTNEVSICGEADINIEAHGYQYLKLRCAFPEGQLLVMLAADKEGQNVIAARRVNISPLAELTMKATLSLEMLATEGPQHTLYGNQLRGKVTVSIGGKPFYGAADNTTADDGIMLWLEEEATHQRIYTHLLAQQLTDYNMSRSFDLTLQLSDGAAYTLHVGCGTPAGLRSFCSLSFVVRSAVLSYWTANRQVHPLEPSADPQTLCIPAEAVAVDLRGMPFTGTAYAIDAAEANPNCLYYLNTIQNLPEGLSKQQNIVSGGKATNIRITADCDYLCPLGFQADFISYLTKPQYDDGSGTFGSQGYSETILLPFDVSHASLYDINDETGQLTAEMLKVLRYYGHDGDSLTLSRIGNFSEMQAYTPYILGVYVGSRLLFIGEHTMVPPTRDAIIRGEQISFVGTTVARQVQHAAYQYDPADRHFVLRSRMRVAPFQAYMEDNASASPSNYDYLFFNDDAWGADHDLPPVPAAISELQHHRQAGGTAIYSLSGQQLRQQGLRPGIYLVGGRKVVVK